MRQKPIHIIVDFNVRHKAARDMIAGIMRYAAAHPQWEILIRGNHPSNDGFVIDRNCPIDGIISGYDLSRTDENDQREIKKLFAAGTTLRGAVFISNAPYRQEFVPVAWVDVDHRRIAQEAAHLFLRNGLTNFAAIGALVSENWNSSRIVSFCTTIRLAGYDTHIFTSTKKAQTSWDDEIAALRHWISTLPKPCGIFATFDQRAKHVADICRSEGVSVPKQVQIIGVDNEESICELTVPSLSSIAPHFEETGYRAARELDRILHGNAPSPRPILVKNLKVIERLSTSDTTRTGDRVNRALYFIHSHIHERISVSDVAKAVGGSRRLLEMDFKRVHDRTIVQEIQTARLEQVLVALRNPSKSLKSIAEASGFASETYLKNLFRKTFGVTMSEFRRNKAKILLSPKSRPSMV